MGAQLNIKSNEAYRLATELAVQERTSITQVVLEALRARRRNLDSEREAKLAEVMELCREARALMSPELLALDMDEYLYDELGLPK